MLRSILQKGLDRVTEEEMDVIYDKWDFLEIKPFYRLKEFWIIRLSILSAASVVIILVLFWNKTLKRKIENKTAELVKAKKKAEESDELKMKFIRNLSHEIRTPLNRMLGFSELIANQWLSREKKQDYAKVINESGNQLIRIVDDILEISYLESHQKLLEEKPFSLNKLLDELYG